MKISDLLNFSFKSFKFRPFIWSKIISMIVFGGLLIIFSISINDTVKHGFENAVYFNSQLKVIHVNKPKSRIELTDLQKINEIGNKYIYTSYLELFGAGSFSGMTLEDTYFNASPKGGLKFVLGKDYDLKEDEIILTDAMKAHMEELDKPIKVGDKIDIEVQTIVSDDGQGNTVGGGNKIYTFTIKDFYNDKATDSYMGQTSYINYDTLTEMYFLKGKYKSKSEVFANENFSQIDVLVKEVDSMQTVANQLKALGYSVDFDLINSSQLPASIQVANYVGIAMSFGIMIFAIFYTISALNTLLNTRTFEIGILKAIGFRSTNLLELYICEVIFAILIIDALLFGIPYLLTGTLFANFDIIIPFSSIQASSIIINIKYLVYIILGIDLVIILTSFLTILKFSRISPVDVIRNVRG